MLLGIFAVATYDGLLAKAKAGDGKARAILEDLKRIIIPPIEQQRLRNRELRDFADWVRGTRYGKTDHAVAAFIHWALKGRLSVGLTDDEHEAVAEHVEWIRFFSKPVVLTHRTIFAIIRSEKIAAEVSDRVSVASRHEHDTTDTRPTIPQRSRQMRAGSPHPRDRVDDRARWRR
jgi:hypothetical protein